MTDTDNKPPTTEESTRTDPDYHQLDVERVVLRHAAVSSAVQNSQLSLIKCFLACLTSTTRLEHFKKGVY